MKTVKMPGQIKNPGAQKNPKTCNVNSSQASLGIGTAQSDYFCFFRFLIFPSGSVWQHFYVGLLLLLLLKKVLTRISLSSGIVNVQLFTFPYPTVKVSLA